MEGYTRNPRSHFRPPPQHPPHAPAAPGYHNKGLSNGAALAGGNGFTAYDDVFGGPPKFGATPFAPRAEDYSEIFGSFRSTRSSSIPMLDLPPVHDSVAAFEVVGCTGMEYSDIFGGFDFADFATSYDQLFRRSDATQESSDDAWTPVGTESPWGESPCASPERNKYFLDGDFHDTVEDKVFDFSYHNVNVGTTENLEHVYEPQPSSFPVYTYEVECSDVRKGDRERYSSAVADDIILFEDSSGNISVEAPWKTTSNENGEKAGEANGINLNPGFVSLSDVSLRTESHHLPPASEVPPTTVDRKRNPASSKPDYEQNKNNTIETIFAGGSFDFIDVELGAGSSSIASAAAIKEAMERAKVKINSGKELRKRNKDSVKDTLFTKSDGKVKMIFDETTSTADEKHVKDNRDFNSVKTSADRVQVSCNNSEVLADPLQPEDALDKAAEPAQRKDAKNHRLPLDPVLTEGDSEWKVTTACFELINNGNSNAGTSLGDSIGKPVHEMNNCHFGIANGKTTHAKKMKQEVAGVDDFIKERDGSESAAEACNPRENRRRLRANKGASRNAFHEKMVKLAQDVHETVVVSGNLETMSRKKGLEGDEATQKPEMHRARKSDQATDQVYYDRNDNEDFYLAGSELSSDEDLVQADTDEIGKEACRFDENERRGIDVASKGETPKWVEAFAEREDNGRYFNEIQDEEKEELCVREGAEAMKKVLPPRHESLRMLDEFHEQKESTQKSGRNEQQEIDIMLKKALMESNERENIERKNEPQKTDECGKKLKESVEAQNSWRHVLATGNISKDTMTAVANGLPTVCEVVGKSDGMYSEDGELDAYEKEMKEPARTCEFENSQMDEIWEVNEEQTTESKVHLRSELKTAADQDTNQGRNPDIDSDKSISAGLSIPDEAVPEMAYESKELESPNLSSSPGEEIVRSSEYTCESEEKVADNTDVGKSSKQTQKAEVSQPLMYGRKESVQEQYLTSQAKQRIVGKEMNSVNGDAAKKLKRKEESDMESLSELELEKEREIERELEAHRLRKLEEEREKEREKLRLRRLEELREGEREKERQRKLEEERDREREKDLEKERVKKLEEERQRERERYLEKERLRKLEEEWEREREREKDRMGVELKTSAACERAFAETREKVDRAALERATIEARQRAMAEARERLEKACAEAREKSVGKTSKESQLRAERAAVERATAEARERAMEKAMAERATFGTRERVERSVSEKFSSSFRNVELRNCSSSSDLWNSNKSDGVEGESSQRCRAIFERHRRTVDRVAKALAEKNMRDLIAQREQAERNRFAETLDADIKRWSNGKEGNLRALLSTLQYILGPESGWQSIPLTEVITCAAVKKAYRRATLYVHPDKLQQRGATIQQKYICEKVFDLLKDAWNRFNSEER